jgi:3-hydroxybutyryl-CoA dehydrogenase
MKTKIRNVTIIGAGTIGHSVAQLFAQKGFQVKLWSRKEDTLKKALYKIQSNLKLFLKHNILHTKSLDNVMSNIKIIKDLDESVLGSDFVIEAIEEKFDSKKAIFKRINKICATHTIIATCTSGLSITELGKTSGRQDRFVGTHFLNQCWLIPIVEIVKGENTSEETFDITCNLVSYLGKTPIRVMKDIPGFLLNRLQHAMWREAISLVQNGIANPKDIDDVVKYGFGLRLPIIGPLEYMDLISLDLVLDIHSYLLKDLENSTEPLSLLKTKVKKGELGANTGKGFYSWTKKRINQVTEDIHKELISRLYKGEK